MPNLSQLTLSVVKHVEAAGINVMANYIYGLPETMKRQQENILIDVGIEHTRLENTYVAMVFFFLKSSLRKCSDDVRLPETYEEFSFHSFHTVPLPTTETLPAYRILQLRDESFTKHHARPEFLDKIRTLLGSFGSAKHHG